MKLKLQLTSYLRGLLLIIILILPSNLFSYSNSLTNNLPIIFTATTDKLNYEYGDSIGIVYTVQNTSDTNVFLQFGSSCQLAYFIDEFNSFNVYACLAVLTTMSIPPDTTLVFNRYHNNDHYLPEVGEHLFSGILIGYDTSNATFTISEPVNVSKIDLALNSFILNQNYPNPFNPKTTVSFNIPETGFVTLKVYDLLGNEVAILVNEKRNSGSYVIEFDASELSSGIYFYVLKIWGLSKNKENGFAEMIL